MSLDTLSQTEQKAVEATYAKRHFDKGLHNGTLSLAEIEHALGIELPEHTRLNVQAVLIMPSGATIAKKHNIKSLEGWRAVFRNDEDEKGNLIRIAGDVAASYLVASVPDIQTARFNASKLAWGEPSDAHAEILEATFRPMKDIR